MQQRNKRLLASRWVTWWSVFTRGQLFTLFPGIWNWSRNLSKLCLAQTSWNQWLITWACQVFDGWPLLPRVKHSTHNSCCFLCRWPSALFPLSVNSSPHTSESPIHMYPQTLSILKKVDLRLGTFYLLKFGNPVSKLSCQTRWLQTHMGQTGQVMLGDSAGPFFQVGFLFVLFKDHTLKWKLTSSVCFLGCTLTDHPY